MENDISTLWEKYKHLGPVQAEKIIYKEARELGYSPAKVMLELRRIRNPTFTTKVTENINPKFIGCDRDADGNVIDPYTHTEIDEEYLVSYISNKKRFCFDIRSVARAVYSGDTRNPLNREKLPQDLLDRAGEYISLLSRNVKAGDSRIKVVFDSVFDVLVKVLRTLDDNILVSLTKSNLYSNKKSLYDYSLEDRFIGDEVVLYPFADAVDQAICHKHLFEYCSRNRDIQVCDTLFHELGFLLKVPPVFLDEDGRQYRLDPNDTVYDTMRKIYQWLGGLDSVKKYNLVLDDGEWLSNFNLTKLVSEEIPSLEIRYVYHENYNQIKKRLFDRAFQIDDEEFIRAMATGKSDFLTDLNYTLRDLVDYTWQIKDVDVIKYTGDRYGEFIQKLVNKCSLSTEFLDIITMFELRNIIYARYINWRDVEEKFGYNTAVIYLHGISNIELADIDDMISGKSLLPDTSDSISLILKLDDVELFVRHRYSIPDLLGVALRYDGDPRITSYVLNNEPLMSLIKMVSRNNAKQIIPRLTIDNLREVFNNRDDVFHIDLFIASPNFPQDILDDEQYYRDEDLLSHMINNPNFRKFKEAVVYHIDGSNLYQNLLDKLTTEELIQIFREENDEVNKRALFVDIIDRITDAELLQYKRELYVPPDFDWFEEMINDTDSKTILAYFFLSGITKEHAVKYLARVRDVYDYDLVADYFSIDDTDAKTFAVNTNIIGDIIHTGRHTVGVFSDTLRSMSKEKLKVLQRSIHRMDNKNQNIIDIEALINSLLE